MAFVNTAPQAPVNTYEKAEGFLNLYLPLPGGKRGKLDGIALKPSKHSKLIAALKADPAYAEVILRNMIIEYRSATPADGQEFELK